MADKFKGLPEIDLSRFGIVNTDRSGAKSVDALALELANFKLHTTPESTAEWLQGGGPRSDNYIFPQDYSPKKLTHMDRDGDGRIDDRVFGHTHFGIGLPQRDSDEIRKLYARILHGGVNSPTDYK